MDRLGAFFRWLGSPVRGVRTLFPFTHDGRQTLIYIVLSFAGPALTLLTWWAMNIARLAGQWHIFGVMSDWVVWSLFVIVCALACFVSIRAVQIGKDGAKITGKDSRDDDEIRAAIQAPVDAAQAKADEVKTEVTSTTEKDQ